MSDPSSAMALRGVSIVFVGIGVVLLTYYFYFYKKNQREIAKQSLEKSGNLKDIILGMAKADGKVDVPYLAKRLGVTADDMKMKLYAMLGAGKIEGTFEAKYLVIGGEIGPAIDALMQEFDTWGKTGKRN